MTKIVGHRGAAGLELGNTIPSFQLAKELGVDAIELDVRITKDGKFVVSHDDHLNRVSNRSGSIAALTYAQLAKVKLRNGHPVPLLRDVLDSVPGMPVVIDIKIGHHMEELCGLLDDYNNEITFVTKISKALRDCKRIRPDIPAFIARDFSLIGLMRSVKNHGADGLNLNYFLLNPLTYRAATKLGLQIQVYTVNNVRVAQLLKRLYPGIWICTNHPDKLIASLRDHRIV